jgi:hypothetical protein
MLNISSIISSKTVCTLLHFPTRRNSPAILTSCERPGHSMYSKYKAKPISNTRIRKNELQLTRSVLAGCYKIQTSGPSHLELRITGLRGKLVCFHACSGIIFLLVLHMAVGAHAPVNSLPIVLKGAKLRINS